MINITDKAKCCGCNACMQRCPRQCITMHEDGEGFLYPIVDKENCIDCGLCEKVCPWLNSPEKLQPIKVLAAKNRCEEERMSSSSGGAFIALAKKTIAEGGVVLGAVFDENWEVRHTFAENMQDVKPMMGSKYMQSRIGDNYAKAESFLKNGRPVMFTGTPCQITGLHNYLHHGYPNLLSVDMLCHGVPSPGVWRRYIRETFPAAFKVTDGEKTIFWPSIDSSSMITGIEFRNKLMSGWTKYSLVVRGKSAPETDKNTVLLSDRHWENPYMRGFLSDVYLRPSCHHCKYKNGVSHSDITIADYWGIHRSMPDFDDDKGVSLVLLNTSAGIDVFSHLDMEVRESTLEDARRFNGGFNENTPSHPKRAKFFRTYPDSESLAETVNRVLHVSVVRKTYLKIRRKLLNKLRPAKF